MLADVFDPIVITFIRSYLQSRLQVRWKSSFSKYLEVTSDVPQGSCLGPLIFDYFALDMSVDPDRKHPDRKIRGGRSLPRKNHSWLYCSPIASAYSQIIDRIAKNLMVIWEDKYQQMFVSQRCSLPFCSKSYEISAIPQTEYSSKAKIIDSKIN